MWWYVAVGLACFLLGGGLVLWGGIVLTRKILRTFWKRPSE